MINNIDFSIKGLRRPTHGDIVGGGAFVWVENGSSVVAVGIALPYVDVNDNIVIVGSDGAFMPAVPLANVWLAPLGVVAVDDGPEKRYVYDNDIVLTGISSCSQKIRLTGLGERVEPGCAMISYQRIISELKSTYCSGVSNFVLDDDLGMWAVELSNCWIQRTKIDCWGVFKICGGYTGPDLVDTFYTEGAAVDALKEYGDHHQVIPFSYYVE